MGVHDFKHSCAQCHDMGSAAAQGFGKFTIALSYGLSKVEGAVGTPERSVRTTSTFTAELCA